MLAGIFVGIPLEGLDLINVQNIPQKTKSRLFNVKLPKKEYK